MPGTTNVPPRPPPKTKERHGMMESILGSEVWGDVKDFGMEITGCFCILLCSGPVLLTTGLALYFTSYDSDARVDLITKYNADVKTWNAQPATLFQSQDFKVEVTAPTPIVNAGPAGCTTLADGKTMQAFFGAAAPEDIRDKSLRSNEKFETVNNPWYYKLPANQVCDFFQHNGAMKYGDLEKRYSVVVKHGTTTVHTTTVYPMKSVIVKYRWFATGTASASSVDCLNPDYNYIGDSFTKKTCAQYCRDTVNGVWYDNGNCYSTAAPGYQTGCCRIYYALDSMCVSVEKDGTTYKLNTATGGGCVTGYKTNVKYDALTAESITTNFDFKYQGAVVPAKSNPILHYRVYRPSKEDNVYDKNTLLLTKPESKAKVMPAGSNSATNFSAADISISVRLKTDPYTSASALTNGCSSCTDDSFPKYGTLSCNPQCFGRTPTQRRQLSVTLMALGSFMIIFPWCLASCIKANSGGKSHDQKHMDRFGSDGKDGRRGPIAKDQTQHALESKQQGGLEDVVGEEMMMYDA